MRLTLSALAVATTTAFFALSPFPSSAKTVAECNTEYAANRDAIKAAGKRRRILLRLAGPRPRRFRPRRRPPQRQQPPKLPRLQRLRPSPPSPGRPYPPPKPPRRPTRVVPRPTPRPRRTVLPTPSCGSIRDPASTILLGPATTAPRSRASICARPMPRPLATAPPRMKSIRNRRGRDAMILQWLRDRK
jgi:hypothetical protein